MKLIFQYKSSSSLQTKNFAKKIAKHLKNGDVIILSGSLGTGKTTFTKGIVSCFNKNKIAKSPSFTLTNIYKTFVATIYHFDFYRINNIDEQLAIFYEEYQKDGIFIIEWGEKIKEKVKEDFLLIKIQKADVGAGLVPTQKSSSNRPLGLLEASSQKIAIRTNSTAQSEKNKRVINVYAKKKSKWGKIF